MQKKNVSQKHNRAKALSHSQVKCKNFLKTYLSLITHCLTNKDKEKLLFISTH